MIESYNHSIIYSFIHFFSLINTLFVKIKPLNTKFSNIYNSKNLLNNNSIY